MYRNYEKMDKVFDFISEILIDMIGILIFGFIEVLTISLIGVLNFTECVLGILGISIAFGGMVIYSIKNIVEMIMDMKC